MGGGRGEGLNFYTMKTIEDLYQMKQNGKIGFAELVLLSEHAPVYLQWCDDHGIEPDDLNAELFLDQTENRIYDDGDDYEPEMAGALA
jgi:hypothetical protein